MKLRKVESRRPYLKALIYGEPDSGKTTLAASGHSSKEFAPTVVARFEDGSESLANSNALETPLLTTQAAIEEMAKGLVSGSGDFKGVKTLVVDSVTAMQTMLLNSIVADRMKKKGGTNGIPELGDYRSLGQLTMNYLRMFHDLDMHVIFIALAKEVKDDDEGPVTAIIPSLIGQSSRNLRALVSCVWPLVKKPAKDGKPTSVSMLTDSAGLYYARTRHPGFSRALGMIIENPNLNDIWKKYDQPV